MVVYEDNVSRGSRAISVDPLRSDSLGLGVVRPDSTLNGFRDAGGRAERVVALGERNGASRGLRGSTEIRITTGHLRTKCIGLNLNARTCSCQH